MTKFKIGDKVRVTKDQLSAKNEKGELYNKGDIDIVTEVQHGIETSYRVGSRGYSNWIDEDNLELVEKAEDVKTKTEGEEMIKFKIGDKVKGLAWYSGTKHTGTIIEIDEDDITTTYRIKSDTQGQPWLKDNTVERVEELTHYKKLMIFMEENEIELTELHDLVKNLDKLGDLEFEIQDTKDLIEETEEDLERLYEELSELEDERNELLN